MVWYCVYCLQADAAGVITHTVQIDVSQFEKTFSSTLQDLMMVIHLTALTKTQVSRAVVELYVLTPPKIQLQEKLSSGL